MVNHEQKRVCSVVGGVPLTRVGSKIDRDFASAQAMLIQMKSSPKKEDQLGSGLRMGRLELYFNSIPLEYI
jgi:hypothetical protein